MCARRNLLLAAAALWTLVTLPPAAARAQGLPADDEIVLPGGAAEPARPSPAARPAPPRGERRRPARRRGAEARRARRSAAPIDDPGREPASDDDEDAEAARLEEEGIEWEVRQEIEWEERQRREREERERADSLERERRDAERRQVEDDERAARRRERDERDRDRRDRDRRERDRRDRDERDRDDERDDGDDERPRREPADLVHVEVGLSASTRSQTVDQPTGGTIHFGLTPFASAFGSAVLTPFARMDGGPRGLGVALSYDRAIRMEAVTDQEVLEASADHLSAMLLYRFTLPGRVRIEPRAGYDLARFLLAPNDTLPGIVYESIALGGQVQIPILRDPRTGRDRLRVRLGAHMYFPIGLGEAAMRWGQSGSAQGFAFEGGVEGTVSDLFGYFAVLRHASYTATFHSPDATGETESEDGMTTGLCGGSVRF